MGVIMVKNFLYYYMNWRLKSYVHDSYPHSIVGRGVVTILFPKQDSQYIGMEKYFVMYR